MAAPLDNNERALRAPNCAEFRDGVELINNQRICEFEHCS
jgi:hypothetical protein